MRIEAKEAFKFASSGKATAALASYEDAGYGVLAATDWKSAGSFTFIEATLELDVDMVGWRDSFEFFATAAQEGEVDLWDKDSDVFFRISKGKGKRKASIKKQKSGFGTLFTNRTAVWGDAIAKLEKAQTKAKAKAAADRSAAEAFSAKLLVASFATGASARGMVVEHDGTVTVLAGGSISRVGQDGLLTSWRVDPEDSVQSFGCFARVAPDTLVIWDEWRPELAILGPTGIETMTVAPAKTAPENENAYVCEVYPSSRPNELIVRERHAVRRIDFTTKTEICELALAEVPSYATVHTAELPQRLVCRRNSTGGVRLPEGIAFARNEGEEGTIIVLNDDLSEAYHVTFPGRVRSLAVREGELFALVSTSAVAASIFPITPSGAGTALLKVASDSGRIAPLDDGFMVCAGFATYWNTPIGDRSRGIGTGPLVPVPQGHGVVAVAPLTYEGRVEVLRHALPEWRADAKTTLVGLTWVGDELVGWGYGSTLYRMRNGSETAERILGHCAPIQTVVALGGTKFASLAEDGELRFWDLGRS